MVNLRSIDLNLLTIFEAVYEERSQVRAAQRLGMTQPAVSNAMNRLRSLMGGDRLFLGRAKGLVTTSKADDLYEGIHVALVAIRGVLDTRDAFDPATSRRTFSINISFGSGSLIGLRLFRRLREVAPNIRLVIRDIDPVDEIMGLLRTQSLDLAVHHARFDSPTLEQSTFMSFQAVLIAREGHPRIDSAVGSMERLLEEEYDMASFPTQRSSPPLATPAMPNRGRGVEVFGPVGRARLFALRPTLRWFPSSCSRRYTKVRPSKKRRHSGRDCRTNRQDSRFARLRRP